ncbi:MAG: NADH-quinone oxidoreductase subunit NuoH [Leptospirales bacterium]|nr:NADH-quinone oxidoreductase subunit NuoH [Leptospirales bacterium]
MSHDLSIVLAKAGFALALLLAMVPLLVWMERKVSARFQRRIGPNRAGPFGLLQTLFDAGKLMFKEQFAPRGADRFIFFIAPVMTFMPAVVSFGLIPMGDLQLGDSDILISVTRADLALVAIMAFSSLASYGIAYAGWSSSNQYSLMGGIRSCAQLVSYEIVLGLAVISVVLLTGSLDLATIVEKQNHLLFGWLPAWNIFLQPLTFFLFLIAAFAETNRAPFDLPEAEQELVGGYHTEYSGLRWSWFMFGEYAALFTMCSLITTLFLGGYTLPGVNDLAAPGWPAALLGFGIFMTKVFALIFFFMWVRWTLPRLRWDQLMKLGWMRLIPLGLVNVFLTVLVVERLRGIL